MERVPAQRLDLKSGGRRLGFSPLSWSRGLVAAGLAVFFWLLLGCALLGKAYAAPPALSFAPAVHYAMPSAENAIRIATGPLRTGATVSDVVTGDSNGNVTVFLNNGDGTFAPGVDYPTGGGSVTGLAIADVTGDGHPDIVATVGSGIYVFPGLGTGAFHAAVSVPNYDNGSGDSASALAVGDFLHNGRIDLAVG